MTSAHSRPVDHPPFLPSATALASQCGDVGLAISEVLEALSVDPTTGRCRQTIAQLRGATTLVERLALALAQDA